MTLPYDNHINDSWGESRNHNHAPICNACWQEKQTSQSEAGEIVFLMAVTLLTILCAGTPDLLDALVKYFMGTCV